MNFLLFPSARLTFKHFKDRIIKFCYEVFIGISVGKSFEAAKSHKIPRPNYSQDDEFLKRLNSTETKFIII